MTLKQKLLLVFLTIIVMFIANNVIFFYSFNNSLENNLERKAEEIAKQITISIEHSEYGGRYVEQLIGEKLRFAALAIQGNLDPDVNNVTNEQLVHLRNVLDISDITLFVESDDDIVSVKSSDPKEVQLSTKGWGYWYTAFQQLFKYKNAYIPEGQKLSNYWAGPFAVSVSNPGRIDKWGYYYDGTTNYMINPYVTSDHIQHYESLTGPNAILQKTLRNNSSLLEITGFNPRTFGKPPVFSEYPDSTTYISKENQPIMFGSYLQYQDPENDVRNVERAVAEKRMITYRTEINGKQVIKNFIPVNAAQPYVIGLVTDYKVIQQELHRQVLFYSFILLVCFIVTMAVIYFIYRFIQDAKDAAISSTQEVYIEGVNRMFATIRGQRHDFINHVNAISSLLHFNEIDELREYVKQFTGEIKQVNDVIRIGHPAIAAIVQSKVVEATGVDKKIQFTHNFADISELASFGAKSFEIVKVIGNLVDNAFDEVIRLPVDLRKVELKGWMKHNCLMISVTNLYGRVITEEDKEKIFIPGYSTKSGDGNHSGLGLSIVKEIVDQHKGSIRIISDESNGTTFEVKIPF